MAQRPNPILVVALRAPRALYRRRLGWLLGHRFLLLEHIGRITGHQHQTVLEVIDYDPSSGEAIVMSGWGKTSDWYRNVESTGRARITVGRQSMGALASVLTDTEAASALAGYRSATAGSGQSFAVCSANWPESNMTGPRRADSP
jgi:deazaflavin-dependent oxidoreductase (nitroreductase family)